MPFESVNDQFPLSCCNAESIHPSYESSHPSQRSLLILILMGEDCRHKPEGLAVLMIHPIMSQWDLGTLLAVNLNNLYAHAQPKIQETNTNTNTNTNTRYKKVNQIQICR